MQSLIKIIILGVEIVEFKYAKAAQKNGYLYPRVAYGFAETYDLLYPRTIYIAYIF
jgi:hypothetical protein